MSAQYLIRFDDICPTMKWPIWEQVEEILLSSSVKPILAVVPDNQDPKLKVGEPNTSFWDQVRMWQNRGWTIGLHGYQHRYVTADGGMMGINKRSEFSSLSYPEQQSKLQQALEIFERERVRPDLWIAPAHSFDEATLEALRKLGIRHLSDGFSLYPYVDANGMMWVPQQLWRFRRMPFGLWTICLHFNHWTSTDVARFRSHLREFALILTDWRAAISMYQFRKRSPIDLLFSCTFRTALKTRRRQGQPSS